MHGTPSYVATVQHTTSGAGLRISGASIWLRQRCTCRRYFWKRTLVWWHSTCWALCASCRQPAQPIEGALPVALLWSVVSIAMTMSCLRPLSHAAVRDLEARGVLLFRRGRPTAQISIPSKDEVHLCGPLQFQIDLQHGLCNMYLTILCPLQSLQQWSRLQFHISKRKMSPASRKLSELV